MYVQSKVSFQFESSVSKDIDRGYFLQSGMLVDQLKSVAARNTLISSKLPSGEARTVQAHSGGCYALAFDRSLSVPVSPWQYSFRYYLQTRVDRP